MRTPVARTARRSWIAILPLCLLTTTVRARTLEPGPGSRAGSVEYSDLFAVAGSSNSDVFAVGAQGAVWHFDGQRWAELPAATMSSLRGVWAAGEGHAFATGAGGTVLRCTTTYCNNFPNTGTTADLDAVWGESASDVFAAGSGTIVHYDGVNWTLQLSGARANFRALWGFSSRDVYAAGTALYHYDGQAWKPVEAGAEPSLLPPLMLGVWGSSARDLFVAGLRGEFGVLLPGGTNHSIISSVTLHFDGSEWHEVETQQGAQVPLAVVAGGAGDSAVAVSSAGAFMRFDGSKWNAMASAQELSALKVAELAWSALSVLPSGEIFAVGPRGMTLDLLP